MQRSAGHHLLRFLGALVAAVGFLAWIALAWEAFTDLDDVTAHGEEGASRMAWALTGTTLMIAGMILLHVAQGGAEDDEDPPHAS